jgi:hypothetical protein
VNSGRTERCLTRRLASLLRPCQRVIEQVIDLIRRQRAIEIEALDEIHASSLEEIELRAGFHTLG